MICAHCPSFPEQGAWSDADPDAVIVRSEIAAGSEVVSDIVAGGRQAGAGNQ